MSDTTADDRLTAEDINAYLAEHRNWGRWGHDDELGALNLITAEKRRKSAAVVRTGRTVSLSRPIPTGPGPDNPHPARYFMQRFPRDPGGGMAVDFIGVNCHGLPLTHMAALCHVWSESGMWNGRDPDEEISFNGAAFGGIEAWRDGIVTRGVLLDVQMSRTAVRHLRAALGHHGSHALRPRDEALSVAEAGLGGSDDDTVYEAAVEYQGVIVTENLADFATITNDGLAAGAPCVPVVFVRKHQHPRGSARAPALARHLHDWSAANPNPYPGVHWP